MTKDEALKLALEALEGQCRLVSQTRHRLVGPAITAIKEALSSCQCQECKVVLHASDCAVHSEPAYPKGQCNCGAQHDKTDVRCECCGYMTYHREHLGCIRAEKLKEPEQEPVAWRYKILDYFGRPVWTFKTPKTDIRVFESQPLYTSPPQRKLLTDEQIGSCIDEVNLTSQYGHHHFGWHKQFARAIEAAHGIKGGI